MNMPKIVAILTKEGGDWHETAPYMMTDPRQEIRTLKLAAVKTVDGTIWDINGMRNNAETEDERKMRQISNDQTLFINDVIAIDRVLLKASEIALKYSKRSSTIVDQLRVSLRAAERLFIEDSRRELGKLVNKRTEQTEEECPHGVILWGEEDKSRVDIGKCRECNKRVYNGAFGIFTSKDRADNGPARDAN